MRAPPLFLAHSRTGGGQPESSPVPPWRVGQIAGRDTGHIGGPPQTFAPAEAVSLNPRGFIPICEPWRRPLVHVLGATTLSLAESLRPPPSRSETPARCLSRSGRITVEAIHGSDCVLQNGDSGGHSEAAAGRGRNVPQDRRPATEDRSTVRRRSQSTDRRSLSAAPSAAAAAPTKDAAPETPRVHPAVVG